MKKKIAIKIENIHLTYNFLRNLSLKKKIAILTSGKKKELREEYKALKGVSFYLNEGDVIGIIGGNGAGKSTLLRIISNVLKPDIGSIEYFGNKVALLALGSGFESQLSGRENIYLNGLLLGLSKKKLEKKVDGIIKFAELEDQIDYPVKNYSSGMKSRLKFAIAINIDPDILLIDEVFSVGDKSFREKSSKEIEKIITSGKTIIIVSHNMGILKKLCNKMLWLEKGQIKEYGETKQILENYNGK